MERSPASSEYAAKLFSYPPESIVDFVIGTLDSTVLDCIDALKRSILCSDNFKDIPAEELEKGIETLKQRFSRKMEPISCKLERFITETVLSIPDHVLLPEDAAQRTKYSVKGQKKLLKEIEAIKAEIENEKYLNVVLKSKMKEVTETLEYSQSLAAEIESTSMQVFRENNIADLTENAEFIQKKVLKCKSQMKDLESLLNLPEVPENERLNENMIPKALRPVFNK